METRAITKENEARVLKALGECQLFRALKPEQLGQLLKAAELVAYGPNETIVKQGEPADSFLVIIDGMAVVTADRGDGEVQLGQIPLPSSLGEVSLLLREPRTATVTTRERGGGPEVLRQGLRGHVQEDPRVRDRAGRGPGLSACSACPTASRSRSRCGPQPPAADVLNMLPMELIQRHRILPLRVDDNVLTLGMVDPPTTHVISAVQGLMPSLEVRPLRIETEFFNDVLGKHGGLKEWETRQEEGGGRRRPPPPRSGKLQKLLERVVAEGASDLHLSAGHKPHWRVDGDMKPMEDMPVLGRRGGATSS